MASLFRKTNGSCAIDFFDREGKRRRISIGKQSDRAADRFLEKMEQLEAAREAGASNSATLVEWAMKLSRRQREQLIAAGLIDLPKSYPLGEWIDRYYATRLDAKGLTRTKWNATKSRLIAFFGADRELETITLGDADEFRRSLTHQKSGRRLGENTIRKHVSIAHQFFEAAKRKRLIGENPFTGQAKTTIPNPDRMRFITREECDKIFAACLDAEWKLVFALCRFGGLRCPSELVELRWSDIHWDDLQMTVRSSKTEHHFGQGSRDVPVFPELLPYLEECFRRRKGDAEFVIARYRTSNVNLRSRMLKTIRRAKLAPWPRLFQNLRSSRVTELENVVPGHVVAKWMGHSEQVKQKHYLQVTSDHLNWAVSTPTGPLPETSAESSAVTPGMQGKPADESADDRVVLAGNSREFPRFRRYEIAEAGLEPACSLRNEGF